MLTESPNGGFTVSGGALYAADGQYAVRVLITHLSDGRSIALNSTGVVTETSTSGRGNRGGSSDSSSAPGQSSDANAARQHLLRVSAQRTNEIEIL